MRRVTIKVTNKELNDLEDLLTAHILCNDHNADESLRSLVDYAAIKITCKQCRKKNENAKKNAYKIWQKLVTEYDRIDPITDEEAKYCWCYGNKDYNRGDVKKTCHDYDLPCDGCEDKPCKFLIRVDSFYA